MEKVDESKRREKIVKKFWIFIIFFFSPFHFQLESGSQYTYIYLKEAEKYTERDKN